MRGFLPLATSNPPLSTQGPFDNEQEGKDSNDEDTRTGVSQGGERGTGDESFSRTPGPTIGNGKWGSDDPGFVGVCVHTWFTGRTRNTTVEVCTIGRQG